LTHGGAHVSIGHGRAERRVGLIQIVTAARWSRWGTERIHRKKAQGRITGSDAALRVYRCPDRRRRSFSYLAIDIDKLFETDALAESTTLTVNEDVCFIVGVPEIMPVLEPSDSPAGSDPLEIDEV